MIVIRSVAAWPRAPTEAHSRRGCGTHTLERAGTPQDLDQNEPTNNRHRLTAPPKRPAQRLGISERYRTSPTSRLTVTLGSDQQRWNLSEAPHSDRRTTNGQHRRRGPAHLTRTTAPRAAHGYCRGIDESTAIVTGADLLPRSAVGFGSRRGTGRPRWREMRWLLRSGSARFEWCPPG
jgi:hypothetical protein